MISLDLAAQRGSLSLCVKCALTAPWTVIFGPSGAGKTTLLRLIASLEEPDTGQVILEGAIPIGMVTQRSALFPHMTVAANVAYGIAHLPREARYQRIAAMLDLVGASDLIDRSPAALSGGEAQRVSLARALAPAPKLLLLDEPLSALDASARDALLSRMQQWLTEQGTQTILVTHDAADALATNAEVILLDQGKLIAQGPANEVLATERTRILRRLSITSI